MCGEGQGGGTAVLDGASPDGARCHAVTETHFYEPAAGHGLPHDPFKAIVGPRPIGWVSTLSPEGVRNLAPYSFFNAVCDAPPMIAFSSAGWKNSVANADATREFTWNLATRPLADAMNRTSAPVDAEVDEFALAGLGAAPARVVRPPRVALSPASLECRVVEIVALRDLEGRPAEHWLVIGQVVGVHIDRAFLHNGLFQTAAARPILRAGYRACYAEIGPDAMFEMVRPGA